MQHYISEAEYIMEFYKADNSTMLQLARKLRAELEAESHTNSLQRTEKWHADHQLFSSRYQPAVHEGLSSVSGQLNPEKAYHFLDDVKDYMTYYLPKEIN